MWRSPNPKRFIAATTANGEQTTIAAQEDSSDGDRQAAQQSTDQKNATTDVNQSVALGNESAADQKSKVASAITATKNAQKVVQQADQDSIAQFQKNADKTTQKQPKKAVEAESKQPAKKPIQPNEPIKNGAKGVASLSAQAIEQLQPIAPKNEAAIAEQPQAETQAVEAGLQQSVSAEVGFSPVQTQPIFATTEAGISKFQPEKVLGTTVEGCR